MFSRHQYEPSLRENRQALAASGNRPPADKALFNLGLIYSLPSNQERDPGQATAAFRRLQKDFPRSPWVEQAETWTETLKEMEKLRRISRRPWTGKRETEANCRAKPSRRSKAEAYS